MVKVLTYNQIMPLTDEDKDVLNKYLEAFNAYLLITYSVIGDKHKWVEWENNEYIHMNERIQTQFRIALLKAGWEISTTPGEDFGSTKVMIKPN